MAINDEIAAGGRPVQFENPLNNMVKFSNIQNDMANMALHKQKMAEDARLQGLNVQFGLDLANLGDPASPEYENKLRQAFINKGDPKGYQEHKTAVLANKNTEADIQKKRQDTAGQAYRNISQNPSPENIIAHNQDFQLDPNNSPQDKAKSQRTADMLVAMPLDQRVAWLASQNASAADLKPTMVNTGTGTLPTGPYSGRAVAPEIRTGLTPAQQLEVPVGYDQGSASLQVKNDSLKAKLAEINAPGTTPARAQALEAEIQQDRRSISAQQEDQESMRRAAQKAKEPRQELENLLRDRAALVAKNVPKNDPVVAGMTARINYLTTHPGHEPVDLRKVVHVTVKENGDLVNQNAYGTVLSVIKEGGKPSAQFAKTREQNKTLGKNIDIAIQQIGDAIKPGGLLDQSTHSGIGRGVDIAGNIIGQETTGGVAAGQLAPIADLALKLVPRFEGSQSNADVISYQKAAGDLANPNLGIKTRRAAAEKVLGIMRSRKGQFVTPEMAAQGEAPAGGIAPPAGFVAD